MLTITENHRAIESPKSGSTSKPNKMGDMTYLKINMSYVQRYLKNIVAWGSFLYIGFQLGLIAQSTTVQHQRQQSKSHQSPPKKSIRLRPIYQIAAKEPTTLKQMYEMRNCESYLVTYNKDGKRIDSESLPLYTEEQWAHIYQVWRDQGGEDPFKKKAPPDLVPPFKAGQTKDGKGRGIFATRDIKNGEMTYGGTNNYIFFWTGHDYRRFLDVFEDEVACDLMKFVWPQNGIGPNGESAILGVMDDNSLQNDGGKEKANTGCPKDKHCGFFYEYALRDIKKGEELLCDYGKFYSLDFLEFETWKEFGL